MADPHFLESGYMKMQHSEFDFTSGSTHKLVEILKDSEQDFEWYPTTDHMISIVASKCSYHKRHANSLRILDIGAGDGRVLKQLSSLLDVQIELFAMEKAPTFFPAYNDEITLLGTDFEEQTLLDKSVDIIFCNPPYSQYAEWTEKIIREANASELFFIIPSRWQTEVKISEALKYRSAKTEILEETDFLDAPRAARAHVHVLKITFDRFKSDAWDSFFESTFWEKPKDVTEPQFRQQAEELVIGVSYPQALYQIYQQEMASIHETFTTICSLNQNVLRDIKLDRASIVTLLKEKLKGLKHYYWGELFQNIPTITNRLCSNNRVQLRNAFLRCNGIDFTLNNISAVLQFIIKKASSYYDEQLISQFEGLVNAANVINYKSNVQPFRNGRWRYEKDDHTHFKLDYRVVAERKGGYEDTYYKKTIRPRVYALEFIQDFLTIANNLGFECETNHPSLQKTYNDMSQFWTPGQANEYPFKHQSGKTETLLRVRNHRNGNLHLQFHPEFILAINVEYGRLRGWLRNAAQAAEELNEPDAAKYFNCSFKLPATPFVALGQ